ncbi:MAG: hypothetical protein ACRDT0_03060 [Pseudonocardiaceae bacterium]
MNLLLHGHTHDGRLHRLSSGLLALSTGSAAVTAEARPQEVPNQYQLLTLGPSGVTRHARQYAVGQRRWIGDTRVSPTGSDWRHHEPHPLRHVHATFAVDQADTDPRRDVDRVPDPQRGVSAPEDSFFDRVLEAARVRHPDVPVHLWAPQASATGQPMNPSTPKQRSIASTAARFTLFPEQVESGPSAGSHP